jgi:hypothetical protein
MAIRRLRPAYHPAKFQKLYHKRYDHTRWPAHIERIEYSIRVVSESITDDDRVAADLSCGDGALLAGLPVPQKIYGDFTSGWQYCGPIEQTVHQIPPVDLFICSETLEHIDAPLDLLTQIRLKTKRLFVSTPLDERDTSNPEHYWGWDRDGIQSLMDQAGFTPIWYREFHPNYPPYIFQMWFCE